MQGRHNIIIQYCWTFYVKLHFSYKQKFVEFSARKFTTTFNQQINFKLKTRSWLYSPQITSLLSNYTTPDCHEQHPGSGMAQD